ncbi:MAG: hypothetical protein ACXW5U_17625 [Thermoanaerobaculia bacterium]
MEYTCNQDSLQAALYRWLHPDLFKVDLGSVLLLLTAPSLATNASQAFLFILAAPPLYLTGEAFFSWLFSSEHGYRISPRGFSFIRLIIALSVVAVIFAVVVALRVLLAT